MDASILPTEFTITTPCPMAWERMTGDDRVRYCQSCGKDVYNLTEMSSGEVGALLATVDEEGGELCGRLFQRPDGTLVTSGCDPTRRILRGWQFNLRSVMVFIAWLAAMLGFVKWITSMPVIVAGGIRRRPPGVASGTGNPACATGVATETADACPIVEP